MRIAFFGGIYNNHLALEAAIADAHRRGAEKLYCLGDLGAFGPHPDRVFPLLYRHEIETVQGNYDNSIGNDLQDCQCGYTDPRDNHFAQISYDYTYANTSPANRQWMRSLPPEIRFDVDGLRFLLCHGSPRQTNEFLWESATSTAFLERLAGELQVDVILGTHTGIHWQRELTLDCYRSHIADRRQLLEFENRSHDFLIFRQGHRGGRRDQILLTNRIDQRNAPLQTSVIQLF